MGASGKITTGRVAQKQRTRQALLDAAVRLLERDEEPHLEAIAAEAGVSRATAYRYFPSADALLAVLPLARIVRDSGDILGGVPAGNAEAGALAVQRYFYRIAVEHEGAFRHLLKASVEQSLRAEDAEAATARGGHRRRELDRALECLEGEVDAATLEKLKVALVALSGIEALVVVKDVLGLPEHEGAAALEWAVRALVRAAREP